MAYLNSNKKIHNTPIWLPTQLRVATSALAAFAAAKDSEGRYIFYTAGGLFYKYDTWADSHIKLASPPVAPTITSSLVFSPDRGYYGNVLDASAGSLTLAGLNSYLLLDKEVEIISGTGIGQRRTIISVADPIIMDTGVATAASATLITDTTRRWRINEFIGYQVRVIYGTGASQIRKVLYNNETTLYFQDVNYQQLEPWNNAAFSATAPYALPVATAGLQANYVIERSTVLVDDLWDVTPDSSSTYVIKGGGVFLMSAVAAAPFSSLQYYDVLSDTWTTKTAMGGTLLATLGTDFSVEAITRSINYLTGTATAGGSRTLMDSTLGLTDDRYRNFAIRIVSGTGIGQRGRIVGNRSNYFEIEKPWDIVPDNTSVYEIVGDANKMWLSGNGASSIYQYSVNQDAWSTGHTIDYGQTRNASIQFNGQEAFGITSGVRNAAGITVLNPTPTAAGTGYAIGDIFNITTGGTIGKGKVVSISAGGVVTGVELYATGINYTTGAGKVTTNVSGTGTGLTVNITSVGVVGRITTASNHNLVVGDVITFSGLTEALWNASYTILATDSLTTFDVLTTATATMVTTAVNSTVLVVDTTKNWVVNEHVGKIIKIDTAGPSPTSQFRRIVSNTASTITVATIVAGINGTSRYVIMQPEAFGRERMYENREESAGGYATGGTTTTLVDTSKTWFVNQWAGFRFRVTSGTGVGSEVAIISSTADTLTYSAPGFTPDTTTRYVIMGSFGAVTSGTTTTITDTSKNWLVNQWAGKRVIITAGTGQRTEVAIASNTANTLTVAAITAPDTTTNYTILSVATRGTGTQIAWASNLTDTKTNGNFLISVRGGNTNTIDRYDIPKDRWDNTSMFSPQSELWNTGASYAYDGVDTLYMSVGTVVNDFIYIHALDLVSMQLEGAFQTIAVQGTAHIGNLMTTTTSPDGGKFLFLALCTSRLMYKALIK